MIEKVGNRVKLAFNALLQGSVSNQHRREVPPISEEEVSELRNFFPLGKFFIYGHARSGTTLLTRLVRIHPDVHCNYQGHFFTRYPTIEALVNTAEIESWFTRRSNRWNRGRDLSPVVLRAVVDFIMEREARPMGVKVVGDKSPNSLLNGEAVNLLHKLYPDGKLIFIVRDGRDAVISHRFQTFIDAPQHLSKEDWRIRDSFEMDAEPYLSGTRSIFTKSGLKRAAEGWVKNVHETDLQGKALFGDQYISLRYEDLLADPWKEINKVWTFLDVDVSQTGLRDDLESELRNNPDKDWQHEKAENLVSSTQKGKAGSWRELMTLEDRNTFIATAGEELTTWGYQ
jgi:hypothetical protein